MELGELVSMYRKRSGLTIGELASKSGVPKGTLNKIINGVTKSPSIESMKSIAKALGCTLEDFDDSPQPPNEMTSEEFELIKKYRAIDRRGRSNVDAILSLEYSRCDDQEKGDEALSISCNTKDA